MCIEEGMSTADFLLYFSAISGFSDWFNGLLMHFSNLPFFIGTMMNANGDWYEEITYYDYEDEDDDEL